jgi:hypothetical protein
MIKIGVYWGDVLNPWIGFFQLPSAELIKRASRT